MPTTVETLTLIWRRVLERSPISPEDSFFDIGGTDALADRLCSEIGQAYGRTLPSATSAKPQRSRPWLPFWRSPLLAGLRLLSISRLAVRNPRFSLHMASAVPCSLLSLQSTFERATQFTEFRERD